MSLVHTGEGGGVRDNQEAFLTTNGILVEAASSLAGQKLKLFEGGKKKL